MTAARTRGGGLALMGLLALAALAIATPLLTLTPAQMARSIAWEQRVGAMLLGAEAARVSRERADAAYLEVVPPGAPVAGARGDGAPGQWLATRGEVLRHWLYLVLHRLAIFRLWDLLAALFIIAALVDGQLIRRARMWDFSFVSPMRHRMSLAGMGLCGTTAAVAVLAPFPQPPVLLPLCVVGLGLSLRAYLANLQKRY